MVKFFPKIWCVENVQLFWATLYIGLIISLLVILKERNNAFCCITSICCQFIVYFIALQTFIFYTFTKFITLSLILTILFYCIALPD